MGAWDRRPAVNKAVPGNYWGGVTLPSGGWTWSVLHWSHDASCDKLSSGSLCWQSTQILPEPASGEEDVSVDDEAAACSSCNKGHVPKSRMRFKPALQRWAQKGIRNCNIIRLLWQCWKPSREQKWALQCSCFLISLLLFFCLFIFCKKNKITEIPLEWTRISTA